MARTILLRSYDGLARTKEERLANGTVSPGHLVKVDSTDKFVVHATAGGKAAMKIAVEDALQGRTIDDNYVTGERTFALTLIAGEVFNGWIPAGLHATTDMLMTSNGDGTFKQAGGSDAVMARPFVDTDNSGGGVAARCPLEVI